MRKLRRLLFIGVSLHFGREVAKGIYLCHRSRGKWEYHLEPDSSQRSAQRANVAIHKWHADGIIAHIRHARIARLIHESRLPAVNISGMADWGIPTVRSDDILLGRKVARHLMDCGLQNFGFCSKTYEVFSHRRYDGFAQELSKSGFTCKALVDKYIGMDDPGWVENQQRMDHWLKSLKKPVGIFCIYDQRAHDVNAACRRLGFRVPDDVAIVGVSNEESICLLCKPPLSSIDQDGPRIGFEAARLLDRLMRGTPPPNKPILIPPGPLIVRQSTDIVALDDPEIAAAVRYIRKHCGQPMSVKELLGEIPISRRSLEMRFTKLIGRTPGQEIIRLRIENAQNLLREPNLSIERVARDSGFADRGNFSVCFHRVTGVTPTQYRQKHRLDSGVPRHK